MKVPAGYYVINHYYPEVARKKLSKAIALISNCKSLNNNAIEALKELEELHGYFTEDNLKKHSEHQKQFLKSLKK